jgi:serine protease Do
MNRRRLALTFCLIALHGSGNFADSPRERAGGALQGPASIVNVARKVLPAVVNISIETASGGTAQESLGSGFAISAKGLILTNTHVLGQSEHPFVRFSNNERYRATVLAADRETDVALLRIETGRPVPYVPLGDSTRVQIGEWVIAVGNPFGLGQAVSAGIISAKGRILGAGPYDSYFQTDAAINPGNSGGPLINMKGQAIGINAASITSAGGLGFAIPIAQARQVIAPYFPGSATSREPKF